MKDKWAFKIELQPNIIFYIVDEIGEKPYKTIVPDIQLPLCFSYHPTQRFSLDFKLSLGAIGAVLNLTSIPPMPLPIHFH